jgi:hypothetical protein
VVEQFPAELQVLSRGELLVTETIRPRFTGSWNGLKRDIPVEYRTPQGFNYTLRLDLVSVTDEHLAPLKVESYRDRHCRTFKIWLPSAHDPTKTQILTYKVANGLKYFDHHDELYGNVTGDEWEVAIETAAARILVPAGATGVKALAFSGADGAREEQADVQITGPEVLFQMTRPLGFREGLTAVVGWDKGLIVQPGALELAGLLFRSNWPLGFPIGVLGLMWYLWYRLGRDPQLRPITVSYKPPDALTPAELGTLIDNSPDLRDITATLVHLAVRGYLRIEEGRESRLRGLWSSPVFHLHRLKPTSEWDGLKPHERAITKGIFSDDQSSAVALSDLENRFFIHLDGIKSSLVDQLPGRGYHVTRPDQVKQICIVLGILWRWHRSFLPHGWPNNTALPRRPASPRASFQGRSSSASSGSCRPGRCAVRGLWKNCSASRSFCPASSRIGSIVLPRRLSCSRSFCRSPWLWEWSRIGSAPLTAITRSRLLGTKEATSPTFARGVLSASCRRCLPQPARS